MLLNNGPNRGAIECGRALFLGPVPADKRILARPRAHGLTWRRKDRCAVQQAPAPPLMQIPQPVASMVRYS